MQEIHDELKLRRKAIDKQIGHIQGLLEEAEAEVEKNRSAIEHLKVLALQYDQVILTIDAGVSPVQVAYSR